jgi:hypothetical protein
MKALAAYLWSPAPASSSSGPHPEEPGARLEGWRRVHVLHPSFETLAEFIIGPRFARTRWQAPQDDVCVCFTTSPAMTSKALPASIDPPDYPTGKSKRASNKSKSSPSDKNIPIFRNSKSVYIHRHSASQEGRFAVVTDVGCGMRWARQCHTTNDMAADGEVVWF